MEKIFKGRIIDNAGSDKWYEFSLFDIQWSDHDSIRVKVTVKNLDSFIYIFKNTIYQYTGINDSEGNRIFEGDELSAKGEYNSIVKYGSGAFCIQHDTEWYSNWVSFRDIDLKAYTLTGHNIHDR